MKSVTNWFISMTFKAHSSSHSAWIFAGGSSEGAGDALMNRKAGIRGGTIRDRIGLKRHDAFAT